MTIIGGSDGPTSVFIAGKAGGKRKNPIRRLQDWFRAKQHKRRRTRVMQSIRPGSHTPDELAAFIKQKYHAAELPSKNFRVREACRNTKISIVWKDHRKQMEQLGYVSPDQKRPPDFNDRAAVEEWYKYMQEYDKAAAGLDDALIPLDFHSYEIHLKKTNPKSQKHRSSARTSQSPDGTGLAESSDAALDQKICGTLHVEMERIRGLLSVNFSSSDKRSFTQLQKIQRTIYRYYGVTQDDIRNNTDRYLTLVTILMEPPHRRTLCKHLHPSNRSHKKN